MSKSNDESVMMYIAGYVAHIVRKRLRCDLCVSRISHDKVLEAEIPEVSVSPKP